VVVIDNGKLAAFGADTNEGIGAADNVWLKL